MERVGVGVGIRGVAGSIRQGRRAARGLAVADSRAFVRSMFLASAARLDVLPFLKKSRPVLEIARRVGCRRLDRVQRLQAWLCVGVELGELSYRDGNYRVRGVRARALAGGDPLLTAHYRSMLDYQTGAYADIGDLLRDAGCGRIDLDEHAGVIADVSLAAAPFVVPFLRQVLVADRPTHVLDVGCGTGVYTRALLEADPARHVDAIDVSPAVVDTARTYLAESGFAGRAGLYVGDIREWCPDAGRRYDVITLINNIYYFDEYERHALIRHLASFLADRGTLIVVTMTVPGSVASAHLNLMLTCQRSHASLPRSGDVERSLLDAGFTRLDVANLVPTEPFVGIAARK